MHGQLLGDVALAEHLDRNALPAREVLLAERVRGDLGAVVETRVEITEVDRLGVRAPVCLERHRLLHVRAAQLAHPHVNRVLAALEVDLPLRARAGAGALLAAAGGLAEAGALAAADPLLAVARTGVRLQVVESDLFLLSHRSSPGGTPLRACPGSRRCPPSRRSDRSCPGQVSEAC